VSVPGTTRRSSIPAAVPEVNDVEHVELEPAEVVVHLLAQRLR
jgi:hypothetical protein